MILKLQQHLTLEYLKWLLSRGIAMSSIILSMVVMTNYNIIIGIVLLIVGMVLLARESMLKSEKPVLATCLKHKNMFINFYTPLSILVGINLFILVFIFGIERFVTYKTISISIASVLLISGISIYFYCCKKNGVV